MNITLIQLLVPAIISLIVTFAGYFFARKLTKSQALSLDSETLLKWTQEFKDALEKNKIELEKYKSSLEVANSRIDELEKLMDKETAEKVQLLKEIEQIRSEKSALMERIQLLEIEKVGLLEHIKLLDVENNALKTQLSEFLKKGLESNAE